MSVSWAPVADNHPAIVAAVVGEVLPRYPIRVESGRAVASMHHSVELGVADCCCPLHRREGHKPMHLHVQQSRVFGWLDGTQAVAEDMDLAARFSGTDPAEQIATHPYIRAGLVDDFSMQGTSDVHADDAISVDRTARQYIAGNNDFALASHGDTGAQVAVDMYGRAVRGRQVGPTVPELNNLSLLCDRQWGGQSAERAEPVVGRLRSFPVPVAEALPEPYWPRKSARATASRNALTSSIRRSSDAER